MIFIILHLDNLNCTQTKNKNEKDGFQKETSKKVCTSSDSAKQELAQSEPEQLAANKEEISKIKREHRLTTQPGNGKFLSISSPPNITMYLDT